MKILFFITSISLQSGGPSRSVPLLVKGLAEAGVDITLMTFFSDDMNTHSLEGTSAKLIVLEPKSSYKEIETFICNRKIDLIQLQSIWDPIYHQIAVLARKHHIPYIITPRGMLEPWSLTQKSFKKRLALLLYQKRDLNKAACVYTTAKLEAINVKRLGINASCSIIPNGIDIDGYPCRTDIGKVQKRILFLSRIHKKKGIEVLLDAWENLHSDYSDWQVLIVGNGDDDYISELKIKIANAGLSNSIDIVPPVFGEDKISLYHSSSLFVLPSYSENFGMVVAEALSCGVPVITSRNTPWEILEGMKCGWWIPLSQEALTRTLKEALQMSPTSLFMMGQRGRTIIEGLFSYRSVAAKAIELYEWILYGLKKPIFLL